MTTVTQIERHLRHALLHAGVMPYGLYEYELEELLDELKTSLAADHDDYIFAVTENSGHVAMVLIEKAGHVYINAAIPANSLVAPLFIYTKHTLGG